MTRRKLGGTQNDFARSRLGPLGDRLTLTFWKNQGTAPSAGERAVNWRSKASLA